MDTVNNKYNKQIVTISFTTTFAVCITLFGFFGYLNKGWIHGADAEGFYMMARSIYSDHDLDLTNELQLTTHPEHFIGKVPITKTGKIACQMPVGYPLLIQPFFLLSDIITRSSNYLLKASLPVNGYGGIFGILVPFSTIFFGFIGIYTTYKVLINFFNRAIAALSINCVVLSSSLLWYITGHVTMVHIHSFAILAILIYCTMPFFKKNITNVGISSYVCIGAILSLSVMIRLQNAVFAIIPVVAMAQHLFRRENDNTKEPLMKLIKKISIGAFTSFVCFIPEMLYLKSLYGSYLINSYAGKGWSFDFFHPELAKTLFSTNHGLFLWNPITLLSCIGICLFFFRVHKQRLFVVVLLSICFVATWYLIASWDYTLGNSFGNRGFDGLTLFFALGWAEILNRLWDKKKTVLTICVLLVVWNIQLLIQQRYLGWLPIKGEVPYLQVFKNYGKLPDEFERIRKKYLN